MQLWVWHMPYSFRDVQGLLLASAENTEYKAPSSCWVSADESQVWKLLGSPPGVWSQAFSTAGRHSTNLPLSRLRRISCFVLCDMYPSDLDFSCHHSLYGSLDRRRRSPPHLPKVWDCSNAQHVHSGKGHQFNISADQYPAGTRLTKVCLNLFFGGRLNSCSSF